MNQFLSRNFLKQLLLAMAASLGYLTIGLIRGWSSTGIPSMTETNPDIIPDDEYSSWISAVPPLGAFIGSMCTGPLLFKFGRKRTLMMSSPLFVSGWCMIGLANTFELLLIGRIITGVCAGIVTPSAQVYVSECSSPQVRGILGSLPAIFMAGGVLVSYIFGAWLPWDSLALVSAIFPLVLFFLLFLLPESPPWLLLNKRMDEFEKAMKWLNGDSNRKEENVQLENIQNGKVNKEENSKKISSEDIANMELRRSSVDIKTVIQEDIEKGVVNVTQNGDTSVVSEEKEVPVNNDISSTVSDDAKNSYFRAPVIKPFLIALALLVFQQFSGIDSVIFYTVEIFHAANSSVNDHLATVIVGLVQLLASFLSLFVIDKLGRRPLLLFSGIVMCVAMAALGTYFYFQNKGEGENLGILPLVSLVVFMIGFSVGYCGIPFLLMGEMLPEKQRSVLSSICGSINLGTMFLVIKTYPTIKKAIGNEGAFWTYSFLCFLSCVVVALFLPETKGKSLKEIEEYFEAKNKKTEK